VPSAQKSHKREESKNLQKEGRRKHQAVKGNKSLTKKKVLALFYKISYIFREFLLVFDC
jgi:hypothetical protein